MEWGSRTANEKEKGGVLSVSAGKEWDWLGGEQEEVAGGREKKWAEKKGKCKMGREKVTVNLRENKDMFWKEVNNEDNNRTSVGNSEKSRWGNGIRQRYEVEIGWVFWRTAKFVRW